MNKSILTHPSFFHSIECLLLMSGSGALFDCRPASPPAHLTSLDATRPTRREAAHSAHSSTRDTLHAHITRKENDRTHRG